MFFAEAGDVFECDKTSEIEIRITFDDGSTVKPVLDASDNVWRINIDKPIQKVYYKLPENVSAGRSHTVKRYDVVKPNGTIINAPLYGVSPVRCVSTDIPNNKMVVDGGEWAGSDGSGIQAQIYSDGTLTGISDVYPPSNLFNENTELYVATPVDRGTITWTSPVAFRAGCKLEVLGWNQTFEVTVNGGAVQSLNVGNWTELTYAPGDESQFIITMKTLTSGANTKWKAIRIDGVVLIDRTVGGDTHVEYQIEGATANDVVSTSGNNMTLSNPGGRWIGENYGEGSGTSIDFHVARVDQYSPTTIYYDSKNHKTITEEDINFKYGINPTKFDINKLGIYELTEQPRTNVLGYRRQGDKYDPVYNLVPVVQDLRSRLDI